MSAAGSRMASQSRPFGRSYAKCWQNRLATCFPGGARVESSVEGISISTTGARGQPSVRAAVGARDEIGLFPVGERVADDDARLVVRLQVLAGQTGEIRKLGEREVHS